MKLLDTSSLFGYLLLVSTSKSAQ